MLFTVLLFSLGLFLLYKGGDLFVDAAITIARRFHISEILIGATIVSIGTTIPEITVSALASIAGLSDVAYGNALGSVICNTALVAGILLLLSPAAMPWKEIKISTCFFFAAGMLLLLIALPFGGVGRIGGFTLLLVFAAYIAVNIHSTSNVRIEALHARQEDNTPLRYTLLSLTLGAMMIFFGSNLLVNNGVLIAQALGVPERVIALTFIALGTSLPELVTAITAIYKGHSGVSLGNIIGANLLNLTVVMGLASAISPISVPANQLLTDCLLAAITMSMLTLPILFTNRTSRQQGLVLVGIYALYCFMLFGSGLATHSANVFAPYMFVR